MREVHTIPPCYDENSKILILGSFPSPKSREFGFYYGHPQNRFWRVLAALLHQPLPTSNEEKRKLVLEHGIALWDVLESCEIRGADDASIRNETPNDIRLILNACDISAIFTTGGTATKLYRKHILPVTHRDTIALPSTSPANCRVSLEALIQKYHILTSYLPCSMI